MGRWEPDAKLRLREAALELFASHGFDQTTTAEIAQAAGLTERTFFRHFTDKREVLFGGLEFLDDAFATGAASAPAGATLMAVLSTGLHAAAEFFPEERRTYSQRRQAVIDANSALQERELLKMAGLAATLAAALRARGVQEPWATLAAETGRTVFTIAFALWVADGETRTFPEIIDDVLAEVPGLVGRG